MIYRFTIISDEVDDFVREIQIDPEATFYDFHEAILKSAGYTNDQMTSFFICDDDWEKEKEITLEEMDDNPEMDNWVMKETQLSELVEDEKQKLLYVFDYMTERCFFIELSEIITGKEMKGAKCTKKAGEAPKQTIDFEEMAAAGGSLDFSICIAGLNIYRIIILPPYISNQTTCRFNLIRSICSFDCSTDVTIFYCHIHIHYTQYQLSHHRWKL